MARSGKALSLNSPCAGVARGAIRPSIHSAYQRLTQRQARSLLRHALRLLGWANEHCAASNACLIRRNKNSLVVRVKLEVVAVVDAETHRHLERLPA